jgi:hypothetical protein
MSANDEQPRAGQQRPSKPSYDEIALCAYFIALERSRRGEEGDAMRDWAEAERQLNVQSGADEYAQNQQ